VVLLLACCPDLTRSEDVAADAVVVFHHAALPSSLLDRVRVRREDSKASPPSIGRVNKASIVFLVIVLV
jgi:hypothetical protein